MPQSLPPPEVLHRSPPAVVWSASDEPALTAIVASDPLLTTDLKSRSDQAGEGQAWEREAYGDASTVSNRGSDDTLKVVYINGMNTTADEAQESCDLICRSLGVSRGNILLLYNPRETSTCVGLLKVSGGIVSSRLGKALERSCVTALGKQLERVVTSDSERLLVVGHSQGSVIFQNATDACYDECTRTEEGKRRWEAASERIEAVFYAPVIRHTAPGLKVAGFTFDCDLAGRGGNSLSAIVASAKRGLGWRAYHPIDMVIQPPRRMQGQLSANWLSSHSMLSLILDDAQFNVHWYGTEKDGSFSTELLAARLAHSIRNGLRSDNLHREMINAAIDSRGSSFAGHFLRRIDLECGEGWIKRFRLPPKMIARLNSEVDGANH